MPNLADLERQFNALKGANLALDLTRGKPAAEQLDLANDLDGICGGGVSSPKTAPTSATTGCCGESRKRVHSARDFSICPPTT